MLKITPVILHCKCNSPTKNTSSVLDSTVCVCINGEVKKQKQTQL